MKSALVAWALVALLASTLSGKLASADQDKRPPSSEENPTTDEDKKAVPQSKEVEKEDRGEIEPSAGGVGPGKAITEASIRQGIKLSDAAIKCLGLKFVAANGTKTLNVPPSALVYHQAEIGIYRARGGWIKLIDVDLINKSNSSITVRTSDIDMGDRIVVDGVALLRVAELDAFSGSADHD